MHARDKTLSALVLLAGLVTASCRSTSAEEVIGKESTFAEQMALGTLHWNVEADGDTQLVVRDPSGTILKKDVTGQLSFTTSKSTEPETVNLELNEKSGVAKANGPDLDKELTEVRYALVVSGTPYIGVIHLPKAGTEGLAESAKKNAASPETKATHGGSVVAAGEERFELVADSSSGEVRVHPLGGKPPKQVKLALDADEPKVLELAHHESGYYFAALPSHKPPKKLTLLVIDADENRHVALLGHRPGKPLEISARPAFWTHRGWGRGHYKGTPAGPPGQVKKASAAKGAPKPKAKSK
jgi:hypothetical protein